MEHQKLNAAKELVQFSLSSKFGFNVPERVQIIFNDFMHRYPDMSLKDFDLLRPDLSKIIFSSNERNSVYFENAEQFITKLYDSNRTGEINEFLTPLEQMVLNMTESQYLNIASNHDLPLEQRLALAEAWENRKTPERILEETLNNEDLSVAERIEAAYKFENEISPKEQERAENERKDWIKDNNVSLLEKIDLLTKKPQNEPQE